MRIQFRTGRKAYIAQFAQVRQAVGPPVQTKRLLVAECFAAHVAAVHIVRARFGLMFLERVARNEAHGTVRARERFLLRVNALVHAEVGFLRKTLSAQITGVGFFA